MMSWEINDICSADAMHTIVRTDSTRLKGNLKGPLLLTQYGRLFWGIAQAHKSLPGRGHFVHNVFSKPRGGDGLLEKAWSTSNEARVAKTTYYWGIRKYLTWWFMCHWENDRPFSTEVHWIIVCQYKPGEKDGNSLVAAGREIGCEMTSSEDHYP